jgi:hypothetical protein
VISVDCEFYAGAAGPGFLEHAERLVFVDDAPATGDVIVYEERRYTVRRRWERAESGQPELAEHALVLEAVRLP